MYIVAAQPKAKARAPGPPHAFDWLPFEALKRRNSAFPDIDVSAIR